jgi:monoterpene epsilon-lactone hydrolase
LQIVKAASLKALACLMALLAAGVAGLAPALVQGADRQAAKRPEVSVFRRDLGGVSVLRITPKGWKDNGKRLVYVHGGSQPFLSAHGMMAGGAWVAARTGLRVVSVDYVSSPRAPWVEVADQVVAVFKALNRLGFAMNDLALYGDSAGGGAAVESVLKMRDTGLGMPAAVVLWSPSTDFADGPSMTARDADAGFDFAKGFPPTLIQGGSREISLDSLVQLYLALESAGQSVTLDLYEGMPQVFQVRLPGSPESIAALNKMSAFLLKQLEK